jgi:hypothetical protein
MKLSKNQVEILKAQDILTKRHRVAHNTIQVGTFLRSTKTARTYRIDFINDEEIEIVWIYNTLITRNFSRDEFTSAIENKVYRILG